MRTYLSVIAALFAAGALAIYGYRAFQHYSAPYACASSSSIEKLKEHFGKSLFSEAPANRARIGDFISFDAITFQGYNEETKRISCEAVMLLHSPDFKEFPEQRSIIEFYRQPRADADGFVYDVSEIKDQDAVKVWLTANLPPPLTSKLPRIKNWTNVESLPTRIGECAITRIVSKEHRLKTQIGDRYVDDPNSGSAVTFANGASQVSYDDEPDIDASDLGQFAKLCAIEMDRDCPKGNEPAINYLTIVLATPARVWYLPSKQHSCHGV